eukprot:5316546-Amphidinium_carterae.2
MAVQAAITRHKKPRVWRCSMAFGRRSGAWCEIQTLSLGYTDPQSLKHLGGRHPTFSNTCQQHC